MMRKAYYCVCWSFFSLLSAAAPAMAYEFSGVVYVDETPLPEARLDLSGGPSQQSFPAVFTDSQGAFNFAGLENGTYTLNITPPDNRPDVPASSNNPVTINGADRTQDFVLLTGGGVVLSGDVRWADGTLAENVCPLSVYLYREDESGNYPSIVSPTYTANACPDIDSVENSLGGRFSVTVAPGTYRLGVDLNTPGGTEVNGVKYAGFYIGRYGGYFDGAGNFVYPLAEDLATQVTVGEVAVGNVSVSPPEYVEVSGKVADENGVGIADVALLVEGCIRDPNDNSAETMCMYPNGDLSTQTDSEGNYIFAVPVHDDWDITLTPPEGSGFAKKTLLSQDFSASQAGLNYQLGALPVLSGDVRWADGTLAENVCPLSVYLYREDESGNYPGIVSPTYTANACPDIDSVENSLGGRFSVTVAPGTYRLGVDLNTPGGTEVNGVKYAGFYIGRYGGYFDGAGNFVYPLAEDLATQVTVGEVAVGNVSVSPPEYVEVSGKVADENGVGIADVALLVEGCIRDPNDNSAETMCMYPNGDLSTQTDSEGNYIFAVPVHDDWDITLTPPEGSGFAKKTLLSQDFSASQAGLNYQLGALPVLSGDVRWADGTLAENVCPLSVYLYREDESGNYPGIVSPTYTANACPDIDSVENSLGGRFSVTVAPGTYRLGVDLNTPGGTEVNGVKYAGFYIGRYGGYFDGAGNFVYPLAENLVTQVTIGETAVEDVSVSFPEYVEISGKVADENGVGIADVAFLVEGCIRDPNEPMCMYPNGDLSTQTDSEGNYIFAVPVHDDWDITLTPPEGSGFTASSLTGFDFSVPSSKVFVMNLLDTIAPGFLSQPVIKNLTDEAAVVAWQTNEPTLSNVSGTGFASVTTNQYRVTHEATLTGLSPSRAYTANVAISDRAGNGPVRATVSFTTPAAPDRTPPMITSGPIIASASDNAAAVRWTTDEPSLTVLKWGVGVAGNLLQLDNTYRTEHEITLSGLSQLTDYEVQASATDVEGNGPTVSAKVIFRTLASPDTTAPEIIAGPFVANISDTEATISWVTNEPAVSGVSANDGTAYLVYLDENLATEHEVRLTELAANTTYFYTVSATDDTGNGPTLSDEDSFLTLSGKDTVPPEITEGLKVVGIMQQLAVVQFKTDEPAAVQVRYGINATERDQFTTDAKLVTNHVVHLTDLEQNSTYIIEVVATDSAGNTAVVSGGEFTSLALPTETGPKFTAAPTVLLSGDTRALIKWETDEAAECYVTFQKAGAPQQLRVDIAGSKTRHQAMLTDLEVGATHNYDVTCRNDAGFSTTYIAAQAARSTSPSASGSFRSVIGEPASARITGVSVAHRAADRLVLRVQTDKPSTLETRYGPSAKNERQSAFSPRYETEHLMVLNNLQANTAHHITIKARDITGSLTQGNLSNQMTTASYDTNAPGLSGSPTLKSLAEGEITISFTGSEYAVSEVSCAASNGAGTWTSGSERLQREHQLLLKGLRPNSTYRCRIKQVDTSGNIGQSGYYTLALGQGSPQGAPSKPDITKTEYEEGKIVLHVSLSGTGNSGLATYTAYCDTGTQVVTASSTGSPVTVTGLDSNKSYTCTVTATNTNGLVSESSKATSSITPEELSTGLPVWLIYEAARQSQ